MALTRPRGIGRSAAAGLWPDGAMPEPVPDALSFSAENNLAEVMGGRFA